MWWSSRALRVTKSSVQVLVLENSTERTEVAPSAVPEKETFVFSLAPN